MSERYWITGVQLGLLAMEHNKTRAKFVKQIVDKQFIGNFRTDKDQKVFAKSMKSFQLIDEKLLKTLTKNSIEV